MKCRDCHLYNRDVVSCTINKNKEHHSYNDEPSEIYKDGTKWWHKNGVFHRENGPAVINKGRNLCFPYEWYYNGVDIFVSSNDPKNNTIKLEYDLDEYKDHPLYGKIAIILKQMIDYDPDIYFCIVDNEKLYVRCI